MALGDRIAVLLDGRFQQVDRPAAIYAARAMSRSRGCSAIPPSTSSDPPDAAGRKGWRWSCSGVTAGLPAARQAAAQDRPCLIGIRPEDVRFGSRPRRAAIPVELDAVTPLNERTVLSARTATGSEILASCSEHEAASFGRGHRHVHRRASIRGQALLFDQATAASACSRRPEP